MIKKFTAEEIKRRILQSTLIESGDDRLDDRSDNPNVLNNQLDTMNQHALHLRLSGIISTSEPPAFNTVHPQEINDDTFLQSTVELSHEAFLEKLYWVYLQRAIDDDGKAFYLKTLENNGLRQTILDAVRASEEFQIRSRSAKDLPSAILGESSADLAIASDPTTAQYIYQPNVAKKDFVTSTREIQRAGYTVAIGSVDCASPKTVTTVLDLAAQAGMEFQPFDVDIDHYHTYVAQADYLARYPNYYPENLTEKSLEHYVTLSLLNVNQTDVVIDIASESSPISEIYQRLTGATTFSQDIMYPVGIHGNQIGGDACSMPVANEFASKAILTCSLEHFERDADTQLFVELARLLKPGGMVCVVPLYLFIEAATQTDPTISASARVVFDRESTVYCAEGWGNRHARFYSPRSFIQRIMNPVRDQFTFKFYYLRNIAQIDDSIYARFAFTATRV